ncbi:uncharacterized protein LOC113203532 [Frankliniella occidentalis]|uniref:Uncharacterized protein LOC113203532 n=1 Tax=Frankliniella occidentalis TaxID=133901 RepID=A0A6J1S0C4_FRAOC|nr:uncharacterized protein LOC113203532 [Frankliniella occidentalis]
MACSTMAALWVYTVVLLALEAGGGACLRDVTLSVHPPAVERGQQARLVCNYDLENTKLYSVKYYRGQREFFRFFASEKPQTKVFAIGKVPINVDLSRSNATQVVLTNVDHALAGNVTCEVTVEPFRMLIAGAILTVVELPRSPPKLWVHQDRYELGDQLLANCSAPPAVPPAQLSFQINNVTMPTAMDTAYHFTADREMWSALSLSMRLDHRHFQNGRLTLQCTAKLPAGFAVKSEPQELGVRPSEPVPERVTSSSGWRARALLLLVILAPCIRR